MKTAGSLRVVGLLSLLIVTPQSQIKEIFLIVQFDNQKRLKYF